MTKDEENMATIAITSSTMIALKAAGLGVESMVCAASYLLLTYSAATGKPVQELLDLLSQEYVDSGIEQAMRKVAVEIDKARKESMT